MGIFILNMYAQLPSRTRVWPRHLSTFLLRASAKALVRLCIFTASSERPFLANANSNNSISHEMVNLLCYRLWEKVNLAKLNRDNCK